MGAIDDLGNETSGDLLDVRVFEVDTTPPNPAVLMSPADGAFLSGPRPNFQWDHPDIGDVHEFDLHVVDFGGDLDAGPFALEVTVSGDTTSFQTTVDLLDGPYQWGVTASDVLANSADSAVRSFAVDTDPPGAFGLIAPANAELINDNTPLFDWADAAGDPVDYSLMIDDEASVTFPHVLPPIILSGDALDTQYELTAQQALTPDGVYHWQVVAADAAGNERKSTIFAFILDTVVAAPALVFPAGGATVGDPQPTLQWTHPGDLHAPVTFDLQVTSGDLNTGPYDLDETALGGTSFPSPAPLLTGDQVAGNKQDFQWRMKARDAAGNFSDYVTGDFTIDLNAPVIELVEPTDGQIITSADFTTFRWKVTDIAQAFGVMGIGVQQTDADRYDVQIFTADSLVPFFELVDEPHVGTPEVVQSVTLLTPLTDERYRWQVLGKKDTLAGGFARATFFVDLIFPGAPDLVSPADGIKVGDSTPTFVWEKVEDTTGVTYTLKIATAPTGDFSAPVFQQEGITGDQPQVAFTVPLPDDDYLWRVRATDGALRTSAFSIVRSVTIDTEAPAAPGLVAPGPDALLGITQVGVERLVSFQWTPSTSLDIDQYRLLVTSGDEFNTDIDESFDDQTTAVQRILPRDETYMWKVIALDDSLPPNTSDSVVGTFTVDTERPGAPDLNTPADADSISDATPQFVWSGPVPAGDVFDYLVQVVSAGGDFEQGPYAIDPVPVVLHPATNFAMPSLGPELNDGLYDWRVVSRDPAGNTADSPERSFRVDTVVAQPVLTRPEDEGAVGVLRPLFQWDHAGDSTPPLTFTLQVVKSGDDFAPDNFAIDVEVPSNPQADTALSAGFQALADLEIDQATKKQSYQWRVTVRDSALLGFNESTSAVGTFRIDLNQPNAPDLVEPVNETGELDTVFEWDPDGLARFYDLRITGDSNNLVRTLDDIQHVGNFDAPQTSRLSDLVLLPLEPGKAYSWTVRGKTLPGDDPLTGPFAIPATFITTGGTADLVIDVTLQGTGTTADFMVKLYDAKAFRGLPMEQSRWRFFDKDVQDKFPPKVFQFSGVAGTISSSDNTDFTLRIDNVSSRLLKKGVSVKLPCRWSQEHDDVRL